LSTTKINDRRNAIAFSKRLAEAFDSDKPAEIAKKLGITYQGAKNYLEGRVPAPDTLVEIARSTGYSIHWLLTGEGPETLTGATGLEPGEVAIYFGPKEHEIIQNMAAEAKRTFEDQVRELVLEHLEEKGLITTRAGESNLIFFGEAVPKLVSLPLYGEIAAGEPLHIFPVNESIEVPDFRRKPGKQYMVLRVKGDSMIDERIFDGSMIICEVAITAKPGDTVVAVIDGDRATVKKYYPERGRIRLQPANSSHLPQYVTDDRLSIQGIVQVIISAPSGKV